MKDEGKGMCQVNKEMGISHSHSDYSWLLLLLPKRSKQCWAHFNIVGVVDNVNRFLKLGDTSSWFVIMWGFDFVGSLCKKAFSLLPTVACLMGWDSKLLLICSSLFFNFIYFLYGGGVEVGETTENDGWHDIFFTNTMKDDTKFVYLN